MATYRKTKNGDWVAFGERATPGTECWETGLIH